MNISASCKWLSFPDICQSQMGHWIPLLSDVYKRKKKTNSSSKFFSEFVIPHKGTLGVGQL